jgi:hypothetical protein
MSHAFRIAPKNALIIEWQADLPGARWCFYRICDSASDAKRSLAAIEGKVQEDPAEQMAFLEASK